MQIQNMRVGGANAVKNQLEKLESKKFRERKHWLGFLRFDPDTREFGPQVVVLRNKDREQPTE